MLFRFRFCFGCKSSHNPKPANFHQLSSQPAALCCTTHPHPHAPLVVAFLFATFSLAVGSRPSQIGSRPACPSQLSIRPQSAEPLKLRSGTCRCNLPGCTHRPFCPQSSILNPLVVSRCRSSHLSSLADCYQLFFVRSLQSACRSDEQNPRPCPRIGLDAATDKRRCRSSQRFSRAGMPGPRRLLHPPQIKMPTRNRSGPMPGCVRESTPKRSR